MSGFFPAFLALIVAAIQNGTPLLFGTMGEILTEKSGNLNLGVEGIMFMGGALGLAGVFYYEKAAANPSGVMAVVIALLCAFIAGAIASLIFSFLTISLRANQNVTGLALSIFGTGVGQFIGEYMRVREGGYIAISNALKGVFQNSPFPAAMQNLPVVGPILFSSSIFFYISIILSVGMYFFLGRSRKGLYLRSVGESPATADAAGINVIRYKYVATCLGCMIAGLGGLYHVMDYSSGIWSNNAFGDRGWLAIALVIFTIWRPNVGVLASFLFGGLYILHMYIPSGMNLAVKELYKMLPYVVTIIVLIISSLRNQRDKQPPQSLGLPYFREDR